MSTTKLTLIRPLMTNLKMTVKDDCAVSVYNLISVSKSSCPSGCVSGGASASCQGVQPLDRCLPTTPLVAEI